MKASVDFSQSESCVMNLSGSCTDQVPLFPDSPRSQCGCENGRRVGIIGTTADGWKHLQLQLLLGVVVRGVVVVGVGVDEVAFSFHTL